MANQDPKTGDYRPSGTTPASSSNIPARPSTGTATMGESGSMTQEAVGQVKQKAGEVVDQAQQQAKSMLTDQKERAAEGLGSVAQAIRQTGENLRGQDQGSVAQYVEQLADQVERFSHQLRDRELDQFFYDAQNFARRQPGLFLGGAFALGVFLARFVKSSSQASQTYYPGEGYQMSRDYSTTGGYSTRRDYPPTQSYSTTTPQPSVTGERRNYGTEPSSPDRR